MRYLTLLLIPLFLGCGPAEPTPIEEVVTVSGFIRYLQGDSSLSAELMMPDSTVEIPSFLGSAMEPVRQLPTRRFVSRRTLELPDELSIRINEGGEMVNFTLPADRIYIDSLPDTVRTTEALNFAVADRGLSATESVVVFFEPADRSNPKRILVTGPTATGTISLPISAIDDISPGNYEVYLIRQVLYKRQVDVVKASIQLEYFTRSRDVTIQ